MKDSRRLKPQVLRAIKITENAGIYHLVVQARSLPALEPTGDLSPDKRRGKYIWHNHRHIALRNKQT
jgi:hypothetical protein